MKNLIVWLAALALAAGNLVQAAEPNSELDGEEAVRLIALAEEIQATPIAVVSLVEGVRVCDRFQENHVRRATVIRPVREDGGMVRRVGTYDFSWSEEYGWFLQEEVPNRGGDAVRIISQLKGEMFVK